MINILVTSAHTYTVAPWLQSYGRAAQSFVRPVAYDRLPFRLDPGAYVFADLERLGPRGALLATRLWERLAAAGCSLLNHPVRSMRRYALIKALDGGFKAFRPGEDLAGLRFPVFLRGENDHEGSLTPLLRSMSDLERAVSLHPTALVVEFADTSDERGVFRKYSCFRVKDRIIPRSLYFSRHWVIKHTPKEWTKSEIDEEWEYVTQNPHEAKIRQAFEVANIDYGRVDYGLLNGDLVVFEINTNPNLVSPEQADYLPTRKYLHEWFTARFIEALSEVDESLRARSSGGATAEELLALSLLTGLEVHLADRTIEFRRLVRSPNHGEGGLLGWAKFLGRSLTPRSVRKGLRFAWNSLRQSRE